MTSSDNAYDGAEPRCAAALDTAGRFIGAEEADYGDGIGPLSAWLVGMEYALER